MVRHPEHPHPLWFVVILITLSLAPALALGSHRKPAPKELAPWGHVGEQIHRSAVQGYQISYHLLSYSDHADLLDQIQAGLPAHLRQGERGTHHLMMFLMDPAGRMVTKASVVYFVKDPNGETQKRTAVPMSGGYGGDLGLVEGHEYRIRVEIQTGGDTLDDRFEISPR